MKTSIVLLFILTMILNPDFTLTVHFLYARHDAQALCDSTWTLFYFLYELQTKLSLRSGLTLSRPGERLGPPWTISQHIFKMAWSLEFLFGEFSFYVYFFQKVQLHQSALMYVAMATMQLFGLFLNTRISIVFQVFPPESNFLWDNFLCFGHQNSLICSIKANIRSVTMETFQIILLPKYGHRH